MITYDLTDEHLIKISRLCYQEQGTEKGAAAEASLMANLLEGSAKYQKEYGSDIYSFARNSGWFSRAPYWMDNGTTTPAITAAVRRVLCEGARTLPLYVNEHDCFSDITRATSCGQAIDKTVRAAYQRDVTKILNRYGSTYTFYTFPDEHSDPFGYTSRPDPTEKVTAARAIEKAKSYIGYEEKKSALYLDDFHKNAGRNNFQKFQPLAGDGNGGQWCQYFIDAVFVELTGSIRKARSLLCMADSSAAMSGFTKECAERFQKAGRYFSEPEAGDIVYFWVAGEKNRIGHTGIVTWVDRYKKRFGTVEGNTASVEFSDNGGTVAEHDYSYTIVGGKNRVNGFGRPKYEQGGEWSKNMDERTYIKNLYPDELYRAATDSEVDHWIKEIEKGRTYDGIISGIRNSDEGMRVWVERCYRMMLYRAPDADGMAAWLKAMRAGMSRETVIEKFKSSEEYHKLHDKN